MTFTLAHDGVTVIRCLTPEETVQQLRYVKWDIHHYPELVTNPHRVSPVIGGFGAFGNPSSYHCYSARRLRRKMYAAIKREVWPYLTDSGFSHFQLLYDRMSWRTPGTSVGGESFHRDVSPEYVSPGYVSPSEEDSPARSLVAGGWLNLDDTPQYFSCVPGTHTAEGGYEPDGKAGFVKLTPDEISEYRSRRVAVCIPPGHIVIFYNHLIHEVKATKQKWDGGGSYRLYCGWRASTSANTPFDYSTEIADQASPILPSDQLPPIYSTRHLAFFKERLLEFSKRYIPECLVEKTCGDGVKYTVVLRYIPALRVLQELSGSTTPACDRGQPLRMYRPYKRSDIALMTPCKMK